MAEGFTWLRYPTTGGTWQCPDGALEDWLDMGWERCDPPEEINPAIAGRLELERELAEKLAAAERAGQDRPAKKTTAAKPAKIADPEES